MLVMLKSPILWRMHAMTKREVRPEPIDVKALLAEDSDRLRAMVQAIVQATLEAEMTAALGAEKGERSAERLGYRSGYYSRSLITRVGTLDLRVPQDRQGRFSTDPRLDPGGVNADAKLTRFSP